MVLLVDAGVPPMVVLQAATFNAASAWQWLDRIGILEAGRAGGLFILVSDPLEELDHFKKIWRVTKGGVISGKHAGMCRD